MSAGLVDEAAPRTGVQISKVVEFGDVKYVVGSYDPGIPCCIRTHFSPGKSKKGETRPDLLCQKTN